MRNPIPGILSPGAALRLTPAPPIADTEVPLLFSKGGALAIKMTPEINGAVVLQSLSDKHVPYVLVIMERDARTTMSYIAQRVQAYFASRGTP